MQTLFLFLILSASLLTQCTAPSEHSGKAQTNTSQPNKPSQNAKAECDFASYNPTIISHFVQFALKTKIKPSYPIEAVKRGIQGKIDVKILVNRDGRVIRACGLNGDDVLRGPAEEAALQWKFKRDVIAGRESYVQAGISFNFVLGDSNNRWNVILLSY